MWRTVVTAVALMAACKGSESASSQASVGSAAPVPPSPPVAVGTDAAAPPDARRLIDELRTQASTAGDRAKAMGLHRQAMAAHAAKRYAESERLWGDAARVDPAWSWPYYNLACTTARQGRDDDALAYLTMMRGRAPDADTVSRLATDDDLASVRERPAFATLAAGMQEDLWKRFDDRCRACRGKPEDCGQRVMAQMTKLGEQLRLGPEQQNERLSMCADQFAPEPEVAQ